MKNLMTRKFALGVLMMCVLVLGGQGVAEGVAEPTFTQTAENIITLRRIGETVSNVNASPGNTITPTDPTRIEKVTISKTGGIVFTGIHDGKSSVVFTEEDKADTSITGTAVPIRFTSAGRATIKVSGTAYTEDVDAQNNRLGTYSGEAWSFTYIYYVTQRNTNQTQTVSLTASGLSGVGFRNGYTTNYFADGTLKIHNGSGNYPVTYTTTTQANLKIHLRKADRDHLSTGDGIIEVPTTNVSSAFDVYLNPADSQTVTATVENALVNTKGAYINGFPTLALTGTITAAGTTNGHRDSPGASGQLIESAITATVNDGASPSGVSGVLVAFTVRDSSHAGGTLVFPPTTSGGSEVTDDGILVGRDNRVMLKADNSQITSGQGKTLYVQTENGTATVNFLLGSGREQEVTVTAIGKTEKVSAYTGAAGAGLELIRDEVSSRAGKYDVYVRVEEEGERVGAGYEVEFSTSQGELTETPTTGKTAATTVKQRTDARGIAYVVYDPQGYSSNLRVTARIRDDADDTGTPDGAIVDDLVLNVSGGSVTQPTNQQQQQQQGTGRDALSFNLGTTITGNTGDQINLEARARDRDGFNVPQVPVTFTISDSDTGTLSATSVNTNSNGVAAITLTLGDEDGTVRASASRYDSVTASITITPAPSGLEVVSGNDQNGDPGSTLSSAFVVRFEDTEGNPISGAEITFTVETGGGSLSSSTDTTDSDGEAETTLTLGSVGMRNTVRASVDSTAYPNVGSTVFTAEATFGPEAIVIAGGDDQTGQVDRLLDEDLSVQVVDRDDNGVSGVLVRFRITEGRGRLTRNSDRTDPDGYAEIGFTPTTDGEVVVEAYATGLTSAFFTINTGEPPSDIVKVSGDNQSGRPGARLANPLVVEVVDENDDPVSGVTVRFAVTAGGGSVSPASATTNNNGRAQTRLTLGDDPGENTVRASVSGLTPITFKATSGAEVLVSAAQRPPMYWISRTEGKLHRLVDAEVENLVPTVQGITSLAVDTTNNLLYFGVKTNGNRGAIRRANLNGRNAEVVRALSSAPVDIAVADGTLYWLTKGGRIRSVPTEGTAQVRDVAIDLPNPPQIALSANGFLYWTEPLGRLQRVRLTGTQAQRRPQTVATGLGEVLSLAIGRSKVYWTARNGSGGVLQRSNLDGTVREDLKTFSGGVPMGLGVDDSDNKLYWTRPQGKLQRASLRGRFVKDIVTGLSNPGALVLDVEAASAPSTPPGNQQANNQASNNPQTTYSVYDINEDGAVNNADTRAVAADVGNSGTAIKNKRADVDGSGTVDVTDLILVLGNLDDDVAAPAIEIDVKALDVDFDRVQEQVETLLASGDRSIAAQRALLYLQHLLASARPDETVLLANYPNPFNPETWIPYHLAESTDVRVNIYDAQGTLVRVLPLGHQMAGYYTSRSRAAYWDGRNAIGERVASGIYFYQLQTDTVSPMRKMVILK